MPGLFGNPNIAAQYATGLQSGINQAQMPYQTNLLAAQGAYLGQQALQTSLDNQQTQMLMPLFQKATQGGGIHPTFNTPDGQTPSSDLDVGNATNQATKDQSAALSTGSSDSVNSDNIVKAMEAHARADASKRFAPVNLAMDPDNAQTYSGLKTAAGMNPKAAGLAEGFRTEFEARQNLQNQMNTIQAEKAFTNALAVYTNKDDSSVRSTLNQVDPSAEKNTMLDKLTPAQMREYAGVVMGAYAPYTGRPMEVGKDGYFRDSKSGQKIPNTSPVGISPEDFQKEVDYWNATDMYTINGETRRVPNVIGANASSRDLGKPTNYASAYDAAMQNTQNAHAIREEQNESPGAQGPNALGGSAPIPTGPKGPAGRVKVMVGPNGTTSSGGSVPQNNTTTSFEPSNNVSVDLSKFSRAPAHIGMSGPVTDPNAAKAQDLQAEMEAKAKQDSASGQGYAQQEILDSRRLLGLVNDPNTAIGPGTSQAASVQAFLQNFMEGDPIRFANFAKDPGNNFQTRKLLNDFGVKSNMKDMSDVSTTARFSNALANTEIDKMAANINLNKPAITAMLKYSLGDGLYGAQKWGADYDAALGSKNVDMALYSKQYEQQKQRSTFIPAAVKAMDQNGNIKTSPMTRQIHPSAPAIQAPMAGIPQSKTVNGVTYYSGDGKRWFDNAGLK